MRILQATGLLPKKFGGFEKMMIATAELARQRGHELHCLWEWPLEPTFEKALLASGAQSTVMPATGRYVGFLMDVCKYIRRNSIDVVHAHFEPAGMLSLIAGRLMKVPLVLYTIHSALDGPIAYEQLSLSTRLYMKIRRRLAHRVFAVSGALKKQFGRPRMYGVKVRVHYLGVPTNPPTKSKEQVRRELGLESDDFVLICVARHNYPKGIDVLLESLASLLPGHRNLKLLQIGTSLNPEETLGYKQLAEKLGVADRVAWLGERNDVSDLLHVGQIYLQPSRSEGLGLAICEAMTAGLPVVATNVDGIPEPVANGQTGILVEPESPQQLADAIERLIADGPLRLRMGQAGRERIAEHFDMRRQVARMMRNYERMYSHLRRMKGLPAETD
jgi:glycosyltransferase involved in cell wall biosynthesis